MTSSHSLLASLVLCFVLSIGCDVQSRSKSGGGSGSVEPKATLNGLPWGGLDVVQAGQPIQDATTVIVLLHGYGSNNRDPAGMAESLAIPSVAYVLPNAPFASAQRGGRAWTKADASGLDESRVKVLSLIEDLRTRFADKKLIVGGFSQGGTVTANILSEADSIDAAILLSSGNTMLHLPKKDDSHPPLFISHGRKDAILSFGEAVKLKDRLQKIGFDIDWMPFDGGHTVTAEVLERVRTFVQKVQAGDS